MKKLYLIARNHMDPSWLRCFEESYTHPETGETVRPYSDVEELQILEYIPTQIRSLEEMEQAGNTGKASYLDQQTSLLRDELMLLYFDYRQAEEADVAIIREKAEVYIEDLQNRFALTQEEQEHFRELARKDRGYIYLSDCRDFLKNR